MVTAKISRPSASSPAIQTRMEKQRRRDTGPELAIRRQLHRHGLRYRVNSPLPGVKRRSADLIFPAARVAVFVDGCFWHGCPSHGTTPKANRAWWQQKIASNRERDADTDRVLAAENWAVLRVWEHEDPVEAAAVIERLVRERRPT